MWRLLEDGYYRKYGIIHLLSGTAFIFIENITIFK